MAGSSTRQSKDSVKVFIPPGGCNPIPPALARYTSQFDLKSIGKVLLGPDGGSFAERMSYLKKNLESFKKPKFRVEEGDEDDEDEDYDEDEDEDEEDDEEEGVLLMSDEKKPVCDAELQVQDEEGGLETLMGDEKKHASDVELQLPNGDERECKKPRLLESFESQGEEIKAGEENIF